MENAHEKKTDGRKMVLRMWEPQRAKYHCLSLKFADGEWQDFFFTRRDFNTVPDCD